jgi:hypothetical protein
MSGFAPLLGEKQTSDAPTPSADFMSTHPSPPYESPYAGFSPAIFAASPASSYSRLM